MVFQDKNQNIKKSIKVLKCQKLTKSLKDIMIWYISM